MQRGHIPVAEVPALLVQKSGPRERTRGVADVIPRASDEMVDHSDNRHRPQNAEDRQQRLRLHIAADLLRERRQLDHPQEAKEPQNAAQPESLADADNTHYVGEPRLQQQQEPIRAYDEEVKQEPMRQVVLSNDPQSHLNDAADVESGQEGHHDVHGPEDRGGQAQYVHNNVVQMEGDERNRQNIEADSKHADDVPPEPNR
mmetsp:Transcript_42246/g.106430  ORF Transcript_42246/g.106430 Transcript_42246/m.106430 type:complete len:201 (-) Transcript_42246:1088-1690(-)